MTEIDVQIARRHGTTIAIEATRERMQTSKIATTPSLTEIIAEKERAVGRLRHELHYEREGRLLGERLEEELRFLLERLRIAIINYAQGQKDIKAEYNRF